MHLMDVQRIHTMPSLTILQDITMVIWKLLRLSVARCLVIHARGMYMQGIVDQVIMPTLKPRGRWLEIIAKLQECDCVTHKENSISAVEPVAFMITYLSGPVSKKVCRSLFCFIRCVL